MYSLNTLTTWINKQIKREQDDSYNAIYFIILGLLVGLLIGFFWCFSQNVSFSSVITKIGGLGISITTVVGVFYYLYKYDEIETRKSDFLSHITDEIENQKKEIERQRKEVGLEKDEKSLYLSKIEPQVFQEIIIEVLKSKITETVAAPKSKEDGKKDS